MTGVDTVEQDKPKVLNLYAGIGGNRALWPSEARVTAIELDPEIAAVYAELWPADTVIVADAHRYLLEHLTDGWDFIWSSPPCPTHSRINMFRTGERPYRYPQLDLLYGEIILMQTFAPAGTRWLVENVIPYYTPRIPPSTILDRHYGWAGGFMPPVIHHAAGDSYVTTVNGKVRGQHEMWGVADHEKHLGITLPSCADGWDSYKRRQVLRNAVNPAIGRAVWDAAFGNPDAVQGTLWEVSA